MTCNYSREEVRNRMAGIKVEDVYKAIGKFNKDYRYTKEYENWLDNGRYKWAIKYQEKLYPPKYIMSQAIRVPTNCFYGGEIAVNEPLRRLGFTVIIKQSLK
jgi:hypothetical protein